MKVLKTISFIVVPVGISALRAPYSSAEVDSIRDVVKNKLSKDLEDIKKRYPIGDNVEVKHTIYVVPIVNSAISLEAWRKISCILKSEIFSNIPSDLQKSVNVEFPSFNDIKRQRGEHVFALSVASGDSKVQNAESVWKIWIDNEFSESDIEEIGRIIKESGLSREEIIKKMSSYEEKKSSDISPTLVSFLATYGYGRLLEELKRLFDKITDPIYETDRCESGSVVDRYFVAGVYVIATSGQKFVSQLTSIIASMYSNVTFYYRYEGAQTGFFLSVPPMQINTALMDEFRLILDLVINEVSKNNKKVVVFSNNEEKYKRLISSLPPVFKELFYTPDDKTYVYMPALRALMEVYDAWRLKYIKHGYGWSMFRELQNIAAILEVLGEKTMPWFELTKGLKDSFDRWALVWLGDLIPQTVEHRHLHSKRNMEEGMAFLTGIKDEIYKKFSLVEIFWFYYIFILASFIHDLGHNFPGTKYYPHYYLEPGSVRNLHGYVSAWMLWKAWNEIKDRKGLPKLDGNIEKWAMLSFAFPFSLGKDGLGSDVFRRYKDKGKLEEFYEKFDWIIKSVMLISIYHRRFAPVFEGETGNITKQNVKKFKKLIGEEEFSIFNEYLCVFESNGQFGLRLKTLEDVLSEISREVEKRFFIGSVLTGSEKERLFLLLHVFFRFMDALDVTWERAGSRDYIGVRMWISSLQRNAIESLRDHVARSALPENMVWLYDALKEQIDFLDGNYRHYAKHGWIKGIYPLWEESSSNNLILSLHFIFRQPSRASVVYKERWHYFRESLRSKDNSIVVESVPEEVLDVSIEVKDELTDEYKLFVEAWKKMYFSKKIAEKPKFVFEKEVEGDVDNE